MSKDIKNNIRYVSGVFGETLAERHFSKLGFNTIAKRYKTKYGEIDLIVVDNVKKMLVFVEVKRRKEVYDYEFVISNKQWSRISEASMIFLDENIKYQNYYIRYDAFICFTNSDNIIHIENIFV